jgi:hypothetical protein
MRLRTSIGRAIRLAHDGSMPRSADASSADVPGKEQGMLDVVLLAGGMGFFIISIAYAYGCDRL